MRIKHRNIKKICVIQLQPFGDVFLTTSYFKALKTFYPKASLTYLMKEPYQKIVRDHPFIDDMIVIKKASGFRYLLERLKTYKIIRNKRFNLVIDQQNMPSSQMLSFISGAPYRIGYRNERKNLSFLYSIIATSNPPCYSGRQKFDILKPLGLTEKPCHLVIPISRKEQDSMDDWVQSQGLDSSRTLVISPGSRYPFKKWPAAHFARVADMMTNAFGFQTVLVWGPDEKDDVEHVKRLAHERIIIAPPTTFQEVGALLKHATLLLCNDNAINHSSVAFGVKTLCIFGPTDPTSWSPAGEYVTHRHLYNPNGMPGDAGFGVSPEDVFENIKSFLNLTLNP